MASRKANASAAALTVELNVVLDKLRLKKGLNHASREILKVRKADLKSALATARARENLASAEHRRKLQWLRAETSYRKTQESEEQARQRRRLQWLRAAASYRKTLQREEDKENKRLHAAKRRRQLRRAKRNRALREKEAADIARLQKQHIREVEEEEERKERERKRRHNARRQRQLRRARRNRAERQRVAREEEQDRQRKAREEKRLLKEQRREEKRAARERERERKAEFRSLMRQAKLQEKHHREEIRRIKERNRAVSAGGRGLARAGGAGLRAAGTVATGAAMIGGGAAVAGAANMVRVGASFEKRMSELQAVRAEMTPEELALLEKRAREIGRTTSFTADQVAEGMVNLARAGLSAGEVYHTITPVMNLAGATNYGLAESTRSVVGAMRSFKLNAGEAVRVVDVFAEATRNSLLDMSSLTEAMKYAGTVGAGFDYEIEEVVAAVAAFRDIGLEGSLAGTNFRMSMAAAAKETNRKTKTLKKYKLSYDDIDPSMHSFYDILLKVGDAQIGVKDGMTLFTQRAGANIIALAENAVKVRDFKKSIEDLDEETRELKLQEFLTAEGLSDLEFLTDKLREAGTHVDEHGNKIGAAAQMYNTMMDNVTEAGKAAKSAFDDVNHTIFAFIKTPLKEFLQGLAMAFTDISLEVEEFGGYISYLTSNALTQLLELINENTEAIASGLVSGMASTVKLFTEFATWILTSKDRIYELIGSVRSFIRFLIRIGKALAKILPSAQNLLIIFTTMFAAGKVIAFTSALTKMYTAWVSVEMGAAAAATAVKTFSRAMIAANVVLGLALTGMAMWLASSQKAADQALHLQRMQEDKEYARRHYKQDVTEELGTVTGYGGKGTDSMLVEGSLFHEALYGARDMEYRGSGSRATEFGFTYTDAKGKNVRSVLGKESVEGLQALNRDLGLGGEDSDYDISSLLSAHLAAAMKKRLNDLDTVEMFALGIDKEGMQKVFTEARNEARKATLSQVKALSAAGAPGDEQKQREIQYMAQGFLSGRSKQGAVLESDIDAYLYDRYVGRTTQTTGGFTASGQWGGTDFVPLLIKLGMMESAEGAKGLELDPELMAIGEYLKGQGEKIEEPDTDDDGTGSPSGAGDAESLAKKQLALAKRFEKHINALKLKETKRLNQQEVAALKEKVQESKRILEEELQTGVSGEKGILIDRETGEIIGAMSSDMQAAVEALGEGATPEEIKEALLSVGGVRSDLAAGRKVLTSAAGLQSDQDYMTLAVSAEAMEGVVGSLDLMTEQATTAFDNWSDLILQEQIEAEGANAQIQKSMQDMAFLMEELTTLFGAETAGQVMAGVEAGQSAEEITAGLGVGAESPLGRIVAAYSQQGGLLASLLNAATEEAEEKAAKKSANLLGKKVEEVETAAQSLIDAALEALTSAIQQKVDEIEALKRSDAFLSLDPGEQATVLAHHEQELADLMKARTAEILENHQDKLKGLFKDLALPAWSDDLSERSSRRDSGRRRYGQVLRDVKRTQRAMDLLGLEEGAGLREMRGAGERRGARVRGVSAEIWKKINARDERRRGEGKGGRLGGGIAGTFMVLRGITKVAKFATKTAAKAAEMGLSVFGISGGFGGMIKMALQDGGADLIKEATGTLIEGLNNMASNFSEMVGTILQQLPLMIGALLTNLPTILNALIREIPKVISGLLGALPKLIDSLVKFIPQIFEAIPNIVTLILTSLPDIITSLLNAVPVIITSLLRIIPDLVAGIIGAIPEILSSLLKAIPAILAALVEVIPVLVATLIKAIPEIITVLIKAIPEIIFMLIEAIPAIIVGLIQGIPDIVAALKEGLMASLFSQEFWADIRAHFMSIWDAFIDRLKFWSEGGAEGQTRKENRQQRREERTMSNQAGTPVIPRTGLAYLHAGEAVIPASENPWNPSNKAKNVYEMPQSGSSGGSAGTKTDINIAVNADGTLLDSILVKANRKGKAPELFRAMRKGSGVALGFDRGNFASKSR